MRIVFYSKTCEDCAGNHALQKMKTYCESKGVDFEERRTIFWKVWEDEANEIMKLNEGLKLPFFYAVESNEVLEGFSLTPLEVIEGSVKREIKASENKS